MYNSEVIPKLGSTLVGLQGPVLVTGHTGFKGTWLTLLLEKLGLEVIGVSLPPEESALYSRANRHGKIQEHFIDIRNYDLLENCIGQSKPSVIFHLAAQALVINSYKKPRETFESNVMGTANVLESAFKVGTVKTVIAATTDKVYKNEEKGIRFKESDPLSGKDPYSASKVGAEAAITAWQQIAKLKSGPQVVSVRAGNVIGGGDFSENRLLPDIVRGYISKGQVVVRNPDSTRPWQHVLDPLVGYLMIAEAALNGFNLQSVNFGPDEISLSVREVIDAINSKGSLGPIRNLYIEEVGSQPNKESRFLDLDSNLARHELGWRPKWSQVEAIQATINWWKSVLVDNLTPEEACQLDLEQIT